LDSDLSAARQTMHDAVRIHGDTARGGIPGHGTISVSIMTGCVSGELWLMYR